MIWGNYWNPSDHLGRENTYRVEWLVWSMLMQNIVLKALYFPKNALSLRRYFQTQKKPDRWSHWQKFSGFEWAHQFDEIFREIRVYTSVGSVYQAFVRILINLFGNRI